MIHSNLVLQIFKILTLAKPVQQNYAYLRRLDDDI